MCFPIVLAKDLASLFLSRMKPIALDMLLGLAVPAVLGLGGSIGEEMLKWGVAPVYLK